MLKTIIIKLNAAVSEISRKQAKRKPAWRKYHDESESNIRQIIPIWRNISRRKEATQHALLALRKSEPLIDTSWKVTKSSKGFSIKTCAAA